MKKDNVGVQISSPSAEDVQMKTENRESGNYTAHCNSKSVGVHDAVDEVH